MNIIAVVVTYNRMELLKRNIRCLQQNKPISSIVIVNNGSTDGTTEWLAAQEGLTVINQTNVGGAGMLMQAEPVYQAVRSVMSQINKCNQGDLIDNSADDIADEHILF